MMSKAHYFKFLNHQVVVFVHVFITGCDQTQNHKNQRWHFSGRGMLNCWFYCRVS